MDKGEKQLSSKKAKLGSIANFIFALFMAVGALKSGKIAYISIILLIVVIMFVYNRKEIKAINRALMTSLIFFSFIFILHLFSHSGSGIFHLWFLKATWEGARIGLFYGLKLVVFVVCGIYIITIIDPFELVTPLERTASRLGGLGRPISHAGLSFSLALRFLPEFIRQGRIAKMALTTRGVPFDGGLIDRQRAAVQLVSLLFVNAFRNVETVSAALVVKGYSGRYRKAVFPGIKFSFFGSALVLFSTVVMIYGWRF